MSRAASRKSSAAASKRKPQAELQLPTHLSQKQGLTVTELDGSDLFTVSLDVAVCATHVPAAQASARRRWPACSHPRSAQS